MSVIEITLTKDYVSDWGIWQGIREIIQNGIDGERQYGHKMIVKHMRNGTLIVENKGGHIPREALLIGFSSKRGNPSLSGQFGEGLKLGTLALVRSGYEVVIHNRKEIWRPVIEASKDFNAQVLKFKIRKIQKDCGGLLVEIKGISKEDWTAIRKNFLFLDPPENVVETSKGTIFLDPERVGCIYVRGIFVDRDPKFKYGYDLKEADIDRDRRMVDRHNLRWTLASILEEAATKDHGLFLTVYGLMEMGAEDVESIGYVASQETAEKVVKMFSEIYGKDAVPVRTLSESKTVEHLGKRGVVVPQSMAKVMEKVHGEFFQMKNKLAQSAFACCSFGDLTITEKSNLETAIEMVAAVDPRISLDDIDIVMFADDLMQGQYVDGRIRLSRKELGKLIMTLWAVGHEWCHKVSNDRDGEKGFTDRVERLLSQIAVVYRRKAKDYENAQDGFRDHGDKQSTH